MAATERDLLNLLLKNVKYIDSGACLGSINHVYCSLGGESVPTSKIGHSDTLALRCIIL